MTWVNGLSALAKKSRLACDSALLKLFVMAFPAFYVMAARNTAVTADANGPAMTHFVGKLTYSDTGEKSKCPAALPKLLPP